MERPERPKPRRGYITKWSDELNEWVYEIAVYDMDRF